MLGLFTRAHGTMLSRPILSPAITRARERFIMITEEDLALTSKDDTLEVLTDRDLEKEPEQAVRRAVWAMQKFLGHHGGPGRPVEGVFAAYDLTVALGSLQRVQVDLKPLVAEQQRRERAQVPDGPTPENDPSLFDALGGAG